MAKKRSFESKKHALVEMERCIRSIDLFKQAFGRDIANPDVCDAIGKTLMQYVFTACEAILYDVCCEKATVDGTVEWPKLEDLFDKGKYVDATPEARVAGPAMDKISKKINRKKIVAPEDLEAFFAAATIFLEWAERTLEDQAGHKAICGLLDFIDEWRRCFETRKVDFPANNVLALVYLGKGVEIDDFSEEELDKIYKRRKGNTRDSLLPAFIVQILKEHSDINHRLHINDIRYFLGKKYEISKGYRVVEKAVNTLLNADDFPIWRGIEKGSGYWYSEKDENAK